MDQQLIRIVILMSTFNGERYVADQLHSILMQLPEHGRIQIRDDGSTDKTVSVIQGLNEPRIQITCGANCGFARSFLQLLTTVPPEIDMVMFADQDDIWLPGKINRAWAFLKPFESRPALYGSAQWLVDSELRPLQITPPWPRGPSLMNALNENIITGCTAALNRSGVSLLQLGGVPFSVRFHDWWMYLVLSALGNVVIDDQPTLLYRQHNNNQIGHGAGRVGRIWRMFRFLLRDDWVGILQEQVSAFWWHYGGQLDGGARALVLSRFYFTHGTAVARWRFIFSLRRVCQWPGSELPLRVLLLLHRLYLWPPPSRRQRAPT